MGTFLGEVADYLWGRYGTRLSRMAILTPNRRSQLFLSDELARVAEHPIWQPRYMSTAELAAELSGLRPADHIRAVTELYAAWNARRQEPFDRFWFWGETILADFDSVDKYLVDADTLFSNVHDLRSMDADFSYLTSEQREAAARFWEYVPDGSTGLRRDFADIWTHLAPVYHDFRSRLDRLGVGYEGMIFRRAAELVESGRERETGICGYAAIGFNALNGCEKKLFDWLSSSCGAEFFWDYDEYYISDEHQEAGMFLRGDISRWPSPRGFRADTHGFARTKAITVVEAPSDSMQAKYAADFLQSEPCAGKGSDCKTAVVLTDENLLVPLLHSMPPEANEINITMGYPLRGTVAYGLVDRLLKLQMRCRADSEQVAVFPYADVLGLLGHPCLLAAEGALCRELADKIRVRSLLRVPGGLFPEGSFCSRVFRRCGSWREVSGWLTDVLSEADRALWNAGMNDRKEEDSDVPYALREQHELFATAADASRRFANSLAACSLDTDIPTYAALLRRALANERIPYGGRPLKGIQIMGMTETRCLDFDNVLVLSLDDDNYPGRSNTASFIPNNIRVGYGMPTPRQTEAIHACDFYRLLQRCRNVHLVYCRKTDENTTGEPCRYILQLEAECGHPVTRRKINLDVNLPAAELPSDTRSCESDRTPERYLAEGGGYLSPTALNAWLDCPLRFRFSYVLRLRPEEELSPEIDMPLFGTILHKAAELLYKPLVGVPDPRELIRGLIDGPRVDEAVAEAVSREYFGGRPTGPDRYEGSVLMVYEVVRRYINRGLLPYDGRREPFTVVALEHPLRCEVEFECRERRLTACLGGTADRVEMLPDGRLAIVDYKTGTPPGQRARFDSLFVASSERRSPAAFQTLLYSFMASRMQASGRLPGHGVQPLLYYVRRMHLRGYSCLLDFQDCGSGDCFDMNRHFEAGLSRLLGDIFDPDIIAQPSSDTRRCRSCDYSPICGRDL